MIVFHLQLQQYLPFTVLKLSEFVPTNWQEFELQQYLPFTVLKRVNSLLISSAAKLQQYLPFTVLKLDYA